MLRATLFGCAVAFASIAFASPAGHSGFLPIDELADYGSYRIVLLKDGWQPTPKAHRGKGNALYPPEVACGNAYCTADWESPDGVKASLVLWMSDPADGLVLAPSPFEVNAPN